MNPFRSMMIRFDKNKLYNLDEGLYNYLTTPVETNYSFHSDNNGQRKTGSFEGYRVIHDNILGPSKAVSDMLPDVDIEEN